MIRNFIESLQIMGLGMLGIFTVAIVLMVIMYLLTRLFPAVQEDEFEKTLELDTREGTEYTHAEQMDL